MNTESGLTMLKTPFSGKGTAWWATGAGKCIVVTNNFVPALNVQ